MEMKEQSGKLQKALRGVTSVWRIFDDPFLEVVNLALQTFCDVWSFCCAPCTVQGDDYSRPLADGQGLQENQSMRRGKHCYQDLLFLLVLRIHERTSRLDPYRFDVTDVSP